MIEIIKLSVDTGFLIEMDTPVLRISALLGEVIDDHILPKMKLGIDLLANRSTQLYNVLEVASKLRELADALEKEI